MEQVRVKALLVDTASDAPVVLLEGTSTNKVMPIWIGRNEAIAISLKLQGRDFERPLTHDLLQSILQELHQELERVVIDNLQDSTYYATLSIRNAEGGEQTEIDSRPSDSIALALRTGSPIYVVDEIFDEVAMESPFEEDKDYQDSEEFENFVEQSIDLRKFKDFTEDN